ncbi:hypothetical protein PN498_10445 [Oscillatoria sp. CS-180]|nr:hypothetical protein [Oscillatoria sp. CS-180]MDB9526407.1 hypothetical protein [Oscillatoria sp. CS-180]
MKTAVSNQPNILLQALTEKLHHLEDNCELTGIVYDRAADKHKLFSSNC